MALSAVFLIYFNVKSPSSIPQLDALEADSLALIEDAFLLQSLLADEPANVLELDIEMFIEPEGFDAVEDWESIDYDLLIQTYSEG